MIQIILLSFIVAQTAITLYLLNVLPLGNGIDKILHAFLLILFFHLGSKLFILSILKDSFLYNNNATGFGLSYGPLLYVAAETALGRAFSRQHLLYHLLPFLGFTVLYLLLAACYLLRLIPSDFVNQYAGTYQWIVLLSLATYPLLTMVTLRNWRVEKATPLYFQLQLFSRISWVILAGVFSGASYALFKYIQAGYHDFDLRLFPYLSFVFIPLIILQYKIGLRYKTIQPEERVDDLNVSMPEADSQPAIEENDIPEIFPTPTVEKRYKKSALDVITMDRYEKVLKRYVEKTRVFLEPEVSLDELAARADIPKHHLTQLLNERIGKNFYLFINEYRIGEATKKLLLSKEESPNLLSLAFDCGFNSKSSFNTYFKKITGLTPSAYKKAHAKPSKKLITFP